MDKLNYLMNRIDALTACAEYAADEADVYLPSLKECAKNVYETNSSYEWNDSLTEMQNVIISVSQKKIGYIYVYMNQLLQKLPWFEDNQKEDNCVTVDEVKSLLGKI